MPSTDHMSHNDEADAHKFHAHAAEKKSQNGMTGEALNSAWKVFKTLTGLTKCGTELIALELIDNEIFYVMWSP